MINFAALLCHEHLHRVKAGIRLSEPDGSTNTQVALQGQDHSVFAVASKPTAVIKVLNTPQTSAQEVVELLFVKHKNRQFIFKWEARTPPSSAFLTATETLA